MAFLVKWAIAAFIGASASAGAIMVGGYIYARIVKSDNRGTPGRRLSKIENWLMTHFHKKIDLSEVRIVENARLRTLAPASALTIGNTIYWEGKCIECDGGDMSLLLHELVHVGQYKRHGRAVFNLLYAWKFLTGGFKYRNNDLEREAFAFEEKNAAKLEKYRKEVCHFDEESQSDDWFWLIWD
jgi:hypothetical protein